MKEISAVKNYENSLSNKGYNVQQDQVERIIQRLSTFPTVKCVDIEGRPIYPEKKGRDGGLDLIIQINAKTLAEETEVEKQVIKILLNNDY